MCCFFFLAVYGCSVRAISMSAFLLCPVRGASDPRRSFFLYAGLYPAVYFFAFTTSPWRIVSSAVSLSLSRYPVITLYRFACRARGVGGLPLRCPPSTCGQFALASGVFSCIRSSLADRKRRPARSVSMRVYSFFSRLFTSFLDVLFLFCLLLGDAIPVFFVY